MSQNGDRKWNDTPFDAGSEIHIGLRQQNARKSERRFAAMPSDDRRCALPCKSCQMHSTPGRDGQHTAIHGAPSTTLELESRPESRPTCF